MITGTAIRTIPPSGLPVTLAELKAQCRYFDADEDAILVAYLRSAVEYVENYTGLGLITQTWAQSYSAFPALPWRYFHLYRRPLQAVESISFIDGEGNMAVLDPAIYRVVGIGGDKTGATIWLANGQAWPSAVVAPNVVTVTYRVGFGGDHNSVPELIRHAILMVAATWFGSREEIVIGSTVSEELPFASKALLRQWRPPAIA